MTTMTTWRRSPARRTTARQAGVPTRHPRVHVHAPVSGLGLGLVVARH